MTRAQDVTLCATDRRVVPSPTGRCDLRRDCIADAGWSIKGTDLRGCTTHTADWLRRN